MDWNSSASALARELDVTRDELLNAVFRHADNMFTGKISAIDGWSMILSNLNRTADPWNMVLRWRDRSFWFKDTLVLLQDLDSAGYEINIMTNSWLGLGEARDSDLLPKELKVIRHVFDSSVEGFKKPDIRFYMIVEDRLQDGGYNLMLIDDTVGNKKSADERNWQFFHYATADGDRANSARSLRSLLLP